jgi:hypothetical protein
MLTIKLNPVFNVIIYQVGYVGKTFMNNNMTKNLLLGKTVLVAEDNPVNQLVVKHTL